MASIFTYDPDPPRVSSPWLIAEDAARQSQRWSGQDASSVSSTSPSPAPAPALPSDYGVSKLQAEPQQGPTEYKLHLLLRHRRAYTFVSTAGHADGSQQITAPESPATKASPAIPAASRQARLQHLTTQLLWRLQQSSPHHAPSSRELTIPRLPDDVAPFDSPVKCASLVPGLEESRGALYEIGVSDDGTLMGLTNDEMTESIFTLRIMAASLGCTVDVVRMVIVGDCEWVESVEAMDRETKKHHKHRVHHGTLWVAEALVTPNLGLRCSIRPRSEHSSPGDPTSHGIVFNGPETATVPSRRSATPQLRVTLTGPTTSGKSSLLGTLSTGTLDNGRGKSRLSLLKHRHELVSGVTSSIAQELIGYKDRTILNLSHRNIESWIDIHSRADGGRLVFVSDSGGHPRYRRTLLRGLMNWAPHWSIHCTAAEATEEVPVRTGAVSSAKDDLRFLTAGPDSVTAHLELSLKLQVPVAVIITKLDLASKIGLQKTLTKVLTTIKEAGRIPKIMHPDLKQHYQQGHVPPEDYEKVQAFVNDVVESGSLTSHVPIALTSTVTGIGIGLVHALFESLPLSLPLNTAAATWRNARMTPHPEQPKSLFHVDDTFQLPSTCRDLASAAFPASAQGVIVTGYVCVGSLSVGDEIMIGPFHSEVEESREVVPAIAEDHRRPGCYGSSASHTVTAELPSPCMKSGGAFALSKSGEWQQAWIVSIRNLRLPVQILEAGQAGSVGITFGASVENSGGIEDKPRIRRGMVLAIPAKFMLDKGLDLQTASRFTATFADPRTLTLAVGSSINVYVASVRAVGRILHVSSHLHCDKVAKTASAGIGNVFDPIEIARHSQFGDSDDKGTACLISIELLHTREWVEVGSKVVLMLEGGPPAGPGLDVYVGKVVEISG